MRALLATSLLLLAACGPGPPEGTRGLPGAGSLPVASVLGGGAGGEGWARAMEPRAFSFPADHGPHPELRSEWWYFVGHLDGTAGRRFGFQLTFFRFGLAPEAPDRASRWATREAWMAHLALSDVAGGRFFAFERLGRGALGLAGATPCPPPDPALPCRVWLGPWKAEGTRPGELFPVHLAAAGEHEGTEVGLELTLTPEKPPVLQGEEGLSPKGPQPGNASYYYSLTRLAAAGRVRLGGESHTVTGSAWMDREWSTSALSEDEVGWDWFALQLSDGRELMLYRLRRRDGSAAAASEGSLVGLDGTSRRVAFAEAELTAFDHWESPATGAVYPSGWRLALPAEELELTLTPLLADQELDLSVRYWEGAVEARGRAGGSPVSGRGYVELTGYGAAPP